MGGAKGRVRGMAVGMTVAMAVAMAMAAWAGTAAGQIAPDTPRMVSPSTPAGFGVHWLRGGTLPGDGDAVLALWAPSGQGGAVWVRGGGGRGVAGEAAGFAGVDVRAPIRRASSGPGAVRLAWLGGLGASYGEYALVTLPVGVTASAEWTEGSAWLAPWAYVGVAVDLRLGEAAPEEEFDVGAAADLGVDLALDETRRAVIRLGVSLGDRQAVSVGVLVAR